MKNKMYKIMFALALSMFSANADVITGVIATATTESLSSTAFNLVDGSGMTGNLHGSFPNGQMWLSGASTPQSVVFDLGAVYDVSQLKVWNYNEAGDSPNPGDALVNLGANAVSVTYGTTLSGFTLGGATGTVGSITSFAKASGASGYTGETFNAPFQARYVKFDITSNYGHRVFNSVGLSEVQFVGTTSAPIRPQGSTLYDPAEPYDVNLPAHPVSYSEEQKQAQRAAGVALINGFKDAINAQQTEYRAQPGVYRLTKGLNFSVGQHTTPFTLYLSDCQIIYEDIDAPLFYLWKVESFTIVGPVKVDCDPLPFSQGRIVASDYEQKSITVDILPGYSTPEVGNKEMVLFFTYSPEGIWLPNGSYSSFNGKDAVLSADGRTMTFFAGQTLTRDYWDRLYSAGNLAALGFGPTWLFMLQGVANLTVQDLDFYSGLFCGGNATETCTMTRVRGLRCPGTNRLYGGGGWQSGTRKGRVTLDSCEFRTSNDDLLDMSSGSMAMVWQQTSAREIVVWDNIWRPYQDDEPGSPFEFYGKDFTPITSAKLVSAQRIPDTEAEPWIAPAAEFISTELKFSAPTNYRAFWRLTFDKDLTLARGTLVEDVADRQMDLVMRNCVWSDAAVRVMIQSGKRLQLTNNHFVRLAGGLDVKTEAWWWQGATVNNVLIADNVFLDCNYGALWGSGDAAISVTGGYELSGFPERYPHNNIIIRNNRIEGSSAGAIRVQNSKNVQITGNECRNLFKLKAPTAAIAVAGSGDVTITGNRVENCPGPAIKADWIDGLHCNGNTASNLGTPGNPAVMEEFNHIRRATKLIGGVTATATTETSYRSASQIVDGSGLTGNQHDTHPNGAMWSSGNSPIQSVVFDLGALYDIRQLKVWNYNEGGDFPNPGDACVKAGVKDVRVTYGTTLNGFTLGGATGTVGSITSFAKASGLNTYAGETFNAPFQARYVKFDITSNHGHPVLNCVGLSEVQFVGAPAGTDSPLQGAVIVAEDFSYANGGLNGQNGGTGFSGGWSSSTNVSDGVATGNSGSTRTFASSLGTTGTIWVSFDWGYTSAPTENLSFGGLTFYSGTNERQLIGNVWPVSGHDKWGTNGATLSLVSSVGMKTCVAKITLGGAGANNDMIQVWVGGAGSPVDVSGTALLMASGRDLENLDGIRINGRDFGGDPGQAFDNLLIGKTAADVDATDSISVNAVNDPPGAAADVKTTDEDTPLTFPWTDLTANDSAGPANESAQSLAVTAVSSASAQGGSVSLVAGNITYTPAANFTGADSFSYTLQDNGTPALTAIGTVNITVAPVNDVPVFAINPFATAGATESLAYSGQTLAGKATDADSGDTITYSKNSGPAWLAVAPNGTLSGTPPIGSAGLNTFSVRATDSAAAIATATLQITVTAQPLPLPWLKGDIGTGMLAGSVTHNAGIFTQAGSGVIGSTSDKLNFAYQTLTGDGEIIARISVLQDTGTASRVGVMIRDTLAANSKQIFMGMTSTGAYRWVRRTTPGGNTTSSNSSTGTVPNTWVRLVRSGTTITAYKSNNGTTWATVGSTTGTTFASSCYIGLAVGSGSNTTLNTSQFSNVTVTP